MSHILSISALESQGARFDRRITSHTSSTSVGGIEVASKTTWTCTHIWTLPQSTQIQASFAREGFTKKLVKLFKKELQVGDPTFDDLVYISTDTRDATAALLAAEDLRGVIKQLLLAGGGLSIDGDKVTISAVVEGPDDDPNPDEEGLILGHLVR